MQLFIDSADVDAVAALAETGLVDGVTTNPSSIAAQGRPMREVIADLCELVPGSVSAEVAAADAAGMIAEGEALAAIAPNVSVKLPLTWAGLAAVQELSARAVMTNLTLCFSVAQALLAAKAGATFVSPFVGRLDDHGGDGAALVQEIRAVYDQYEFDTDVLAASIRSPAHVRAVALAGADCATLPPHVFRALVEHPLTAAGLERFAADWAASGQAVR